MKTTFSQPMTKKIAIATMLGALSLAMAPLSIPLGIAKVAPGQHFVNVLAAGLLGPWWGTVLACATSLLRNLLGVGTPLAFPGSMIGVIVAGLAFRYRRSAWAAAVGEIVGSGIIGALVAALAVAPLMNKAIGATAMIGLFMPSVVVGAIFGLIALRAVQRSGRLDP